MQLLEPEDPRITAAVAEFERLGSSIPMLDEYVANIDQDIRDEVRERCIEAAAEHAFFKRERRVSSLIGQRIGDFEIVEEVGSGAMGTVFKAKQEGVDRFVALKLINPAILGRLDIETRFKTEIVNLSRLSHPNIVQIFTAGSHDDWLYFSMAFVDGVSLEDALKSEEEGGESKSIEAQVRIVADVASALGHAHARDITHRDVKPANVLLDPDGRAMLADFGLARHATDPTVTLSGHMVGTPSYMPPERIENKPHNEKDVDCWSLGVLLYELATGKRPFDGPTVREVQKAVVGRKFTPASVAKPGVPLDVDRMIEAALAPDPIDRYESIAEFESDLRRFLAGVPVVGNRRGFTDSFRRGLRKHSRVVSAALVALVATILVAWISTSSAKNTIREEKIRDHETTLSALLAKPNWNDVPAPEVIKGKQALKALNDLNDGDHELKQRAGVRFEDLRAELANGNLIKLIDNAESTNDELHAGVDIRTVVEASQKLERSVSIFGEQSLLPFPLAPRISVAVRDSSGALIPGDVSFRMLDGVTGVAGEVEPLGRNGLKKKLVPPGFMRVRVTADDGRLFEFTRYFKAGVFGYQVNHTVHDDVYGYGTWKRIQGDVLRIRDKTFASMSPVNHRDIVVPTFEISAYEVSNAEYRRFLEANPDHRRPLHWKFIEPGSPEDQLPVVYVSWYDARAYAEFIGARLPSYPEWSLAARGPNGRLAPWTDEEDFEYLGNTRQPVATSANKSSALEPYLNSAAPVMSHPESATPEGVLHMLGNVCEWTESLAPERNGPNAPFLVRPYSRLAAGATWTAQTGRRPFTLKALRTFGPEWSYAESYVGFRCARSCR